MHFAVLYFSILVPFVIMDGTWLYSMGDTLYKPTLGDILLSTPKLAPALVFYVVYPAGLLLFAGLPAARNGSLSHAVIYGALFGAIAYATYDLTNFAILRNWTFQITVIDICWGAFASAIACAIGYGVTAKAISSFGLTI
jgi:uncharacterized membrane protein